HRRPRLSRMIAMPLPELRPADGHRRAWRLRPIRVRGDELSVAGSGHAVRLKSVGGVAGHEQGAGVDVPRYLALQSRVSITLRRQEVTTSQLSLCPSEERLRRGLGRGRGRGAGCAAGCRTAWAVASDSARAGPAAGRGAAGRTGTTAAGGRTRWRGAGAWRGAGGGTSATAGSS